MLGRPQNRDRQNLGASTAINIVFETDGPSDASGLIPSLCVETHAVGGAETKGERGLPNIALLPIGLRCGLETTSHGQNIAGKSRPSTNAAAFGSKHRCAQSASRQMAVNQSPVQMWNERQTLTHKGDARSAVFGNPRNTARHCGRCSRVGDTKRRPKPTANHIGRAYYPSGWCVDTKE